MFFLRASVLFAMNHWISCHHRWKTLHEFLVVFRRSVTGAGLGSWDRNSAGGVERAGKVHWAVTGWKSVSTGREQEKFHKFLRLWRRLRSCEAERTNFQPAQTLAQGLQNTARGLNPPRDGVSSGSKDILPIIQKQYIYEKCINFLECNISWSNHIT